MASFESLPKKIQNDIRFASYVLDEKLLSLEDINKCFSEIGEKPNSPPLEVFLVWKSLIKNEDFTRLNELLKKGENPGLLSRLRINYEHSTNTVSIEKKGFNFK